MGFRCQPFHQAATSSFSQVLKETTNASPFFSYSKNGIPTSNPEAGIDFQCLMSPGEETWEMFSLSDVLQALCM